MQDRHVERVAVIDPAYKLTEKWPIPPGTKWMAGAHEGMINKKEGERT